MVFTLSSASFVFHFISLVQQSILSVAGLLLYAISYNVAISACEKGPFRGFQSSRSSMRSRSSRSSIAAHRTAFASYRIASQSIASLRNASILEINNNTKEECKKCGEVWIRTSEMWSLKCNDEYRSDVRGVRSEVLDLMWRVWDL